MTHPEYGETVPFWIKVGLADLDGHLADPGLHPYVRHAIELTRQGLKCEVGVTSIADSYEGIQGPRPAPRDMVGDALSDPDVGKVMRNNPRGLPGPVAMYGPDGSYMSVFTGKGLAYWVPRDRETDAQLDRLHEALGANGL